MNAIAVTGDAVGPTLFYGAGAGELPTASAVVADLIEIAREIRRGGAGPRGAALVPARARCGRSLGAARRARAGAPTCASPRSTGPGVLGHIAGALGEHGIGIESVIQKGRRRRGRRRCRSRAHAPGARGRGCAAALERIDALPDVTAPTRLVRIEEELWMPTRSRATAPGSAASATTRETLSARRGRLHRARRAAARGRARHGASSRKTLGRGVEASSSATARTRARSGRTARASGARRSGCCPNVDNEQRRLDVRGPHQPVLGRALRPRSSALEELWIKQCGNTPHRLVQGPRHDGARVDGERDDPRAASRSARSPARRPATPRRRSPPTPRPPGSPRSCSCRAARSRSRS